MVNFLQAILAGVGPEGAVYTIMGMLRAKYCLITL